MNNGLWLNNGLSYQLFTIQPRFMAKQWFKNKLFTIQQRFMTKQWFKLPVVYDSTMAYD